MVFMRLVVGLDQRGLANTLEELGNLEALGYHRGGGGNCIGLVGLCDEFEHDLRHSQKM